jgi:hypothetical protein
MNGARVEYAQQTQPLVSGTRSRQSWPFSVRSGDSQLPQGPAPSGRIKDAVWHAAVQR